MVTGLLLKTKINQNCCLWLIVMREIVTQLKPRPPGHNDLNFLILYLSYNVYFIKYV